MEAAANIALRVACDEQETRFARAFALMQVGCAQRAFPGAALAVMQDGALIAHRAFGQFTYEASSPAVGRDTVFDLASVTKVMATTAMAMVLYERGKFNLDAPICALIPEFNTGEAVRRIVTARMLLSHSSGLPAYIKLFKTAKNRIEMIAAATATPLESAPLTRAAYSDIGFILLGEMLERIEGESLDSFCERELFCPLGLKTASFHPAERDAIPPTQSDCELRHRLLQGEVNDENSAAMGGVAGHAGMFANALDVAQFGHAMLRGSAPILRPETIQLFTTRDPRTPGNSFALGWDTPSAPSQSGRHFSPRSFGHLGFTGTSLWCDPERALAVVLLSNRTWPDRSSQRIKQLRPAMHDAIVEAL